MASQGRNNRILLDLVQQAGNDLCADCAAPGEYALSCRGKSGLFKTFISLIPCFSAII